MAKGYRHLTYKQRCQIYILKESKNSPAKIARVLKVDRSTIHRELNMPMENQILLQFYSVE
ncbi:MAG: helix-turn-helix domain-containing protein [Chlamydiales bacterium]|nr:helix-turn-helix domain-containing protein [Chlamydiales bacterium]